MSAPTTAPSSVATPGVNAPLAFISSTNQGGLIAVITALALTFVLVSFLIRGYIRHSSGPWRRDDHIFTAVAILSCIQSAVVFFEVSKGLGKVHRLINEDDLIQQQKAYFANNILYIIILFLSKCTVGWLYLRLSPVRLHKRSVWAILTLSAIWTLMSILLLTIRCPWESGCSDLFQRWEAIGAIDMVTDFALFLVSGMLVKDLRMSWQPKAIVVAAFGTRLLVIVPCALRLHYLNPTTLPTQRNLATTLVVVCTQLQIGYGAMAATFPCLRPFVAVYEAAPAPATSYSFSSITNPDAYHRAAGSHGSNFKLTSVNSEISSSSSTTTTTTTTTTRGGGIAGGRKKKMKKKLRSPDAARGGGGGWADSPSAASAATPTFRPDLGQHHTTVAAFYANNKRDPGSAHSHDSQKMFIERTVDYTVTYDERSVRAGSSSGDGEGGELSMDGHGRL